jgi:hypothetical protein
MVIKKISFDVNRSLVTVLLEDGRIVTISDRNKRYARLSNRLVTRKQKKLSDIVND